MYKLSKFALALGLLSAISTSASALEVNRHIVKLQQNQYVNYQGNNPEFKEGFATGFGSALTYIGKDELGQLSFLGLSDRGPNGDAPSYESQNQVLAGKFFPTPDFNPQVALIKISSNGNAFIEKIIKLKNKDGSPLSGLPLNKSKLGFTGEYALTEDFSILPYDNNGIDPEGLALDAQGNMWISDEYGPFVLKFSKDGVLQEKYAPGQGLPDILKYRTPNRGAEGITITPQGTIVLIEQSILNLKKNNQSSAKTASFCRVIFKDASSNSTKTYAYPIDFDTYKKPGAAKLGDIVALNEHEFLIIEQGKQNGKMANLIYKVDFKGAEDISTKLIQGLEPEFFNDGGQIKMAHKTLLLDLKDIGWQAEKAEGLTVIDDHTLAIINDNDFGVAVKVEDSKNPQAEAVDYVYHDDGSFSINGKIAEPKISLVHNSDKERNTEIFIVKLDHKI